MVGKMVVVVRVGAIRYKTLRLFTLRDGSSIIPKQKYVFIAKVLAGVIVPIK